MVSLFKRFWSKFNWWPGAASMVIAVWFLQFCLGGCNEPQPKTRQIPRAVQAFEVPLSDTTTVPNKLYLRPGQSAVVLEDTMVTAKVPAQGNELYRGSVMLQEGAVVIAPVVE